MGGSGAAGPGVGWVGAPGAPHSEELRPAPAPHCPGGVGPHPQPARPGVGSRRESRVRPAPPRPRATVIRTLVRAPGKAGKVRRSAGARGVTGQCIEQKCRPRPASASHIWPAIVKHRDESFSREVSDLAQPQSWCLPREDRRFGAQQTQRYRATALGEQDYSDTSELHIRSRRNS